MAENTEHYVYIYNDPKTGEAIYVGKGKGWRAHSHKNWSTNVRLKNLIGKRQLEGFQVEPEIIAEGSEENMLLIEVALIKLYGRQDLATGTLLNSTDGGDGVRNPSEEVRAKQRAAAFRRYGGERIFDFEKPETGETFQGNMPDFAKFLGKLTKQVNKLTSADEVHSIAGWIIKDSGVTPNRYSTSFDFFHVGMEEFFTGTQAELVDKTGLSPSLISQMVTETIPHANGWVLEHNKTNIGALKQNVNGNWYSPSRPWNNAGATPASLLTWAMALEIKKVWTVLQITKADIGGISILRSMGLSNQLQHHIVDDLAKGFREKTFEPETDLEWQEFAKSFSSANELPKYNFSGKLIDGRSKGSNRHSSEIRQKIAEAINNDEGTVSIARKLNISRSSVQRFKKKYFSLN